MSGTIGAEAEIEMQQNSTIAVQTVLPTELLVKQQALLDRQSNLIRELVTFEAQLKADANVVPRPSETKQYLARQNQNKDGIVQIRTMLAETRAQLAAMQAQTTDPVFVATTQPQPLIFGHTQEEIGLAGSFLLLFPIVLAITVRIWKRGSSTSPAPISPDRFARLESAMETVAVEVERLGESQRFTSKLLNDAQPKQQPVAVKSNYERLMRTPV